MAFGKKQIDQQIIE